MELGRIRVAVGVALVLGMVAAGAYALGIVGTPTVETVENRFVGVSAETTTVETGLTVANPNPVGVSLGGATVDYTVSMNDVAMASGTNEGLAIGRGNSTLEFTTAMRNDRIPAWWATHVRNGERTQVTIDATVSDSSLGGRSVSLSQNRTVETDIVGQFNATETRPVDASSPLVDDPALYVNATRGSWDRANVTDSATPLDVEFDVYNPKTYPYTVTRVGYTARMNDVTVGNGTTESGYVIAPGERQTVGVETTIHNANLDKWWVSHLRRNQVTDVYIDFYVVVEAAGERFRIDLDSIDYETEIETDIFGTKAEYPTGEGTATGAGDGAPGTATPSDSDDGVLDGTL